MSGYPVGSKDVNMLRMGFSVAAVRFGESRRTTGLMVDVLRSSSYAKPFECSIIVALEVGDECFSLAEVETGLDRDDEFGCGSAD